MAGIHWQGSLSASGRQLLKPAVVHNTTSSSFHYQEWTSLTDQLWLTHFDNISLPQSDCLFLWHSSPQISEAQCWIGTPALNFWFYPCSLPVSLRNINYLMKFEHLHSLNYSINIYLIKFSLNKKFPVPFSGIVSTPRRILMGNFSFCYILFFFWLSTYFFLFLRFQPPPQVMNKSIQQQLLNSQVFSHYFERTLFIFCSWNLMTCSFCSVKSPFLYTTSMLLKLSSLSFTC